MGLVTGVAVVVVAVSVVALRTLWSDRQAPSVPPCEHILTPPVNDEVRTAFSSIWDQRVTRFTRVNDSSICTIEASSLFLDGSTPAPDTPESRDLNLYIFREDPGSFKQRRIECETASGATGFADERGLGDDAFSCWVTHRIGRYSYVNRRLRFRVGNLTSLLTLNGANYGPQPPVDAALRTDLEHHTHCIAEALVTRFGAPVGETRTCGGTAGDM